VLLSEPQPVLEQGTSVHMILHTLSTDFLHVIAWLILD